MKSKQITDTIIILGITIILLLIMFFSDTSSIKKQKTAISESEITKETKEIKTLFGLNPDSFLIKNGKVKKGQNLSEILTSFKLNYSDIDNLVKNTKSTFDVRKINAGNKYTAFCSPDSSNNLEYFVYEKSPINYIVYSFNDSVSVSQYTKEIESIRKYVSDTIKSSLWNAMSDAGANPLLANDLSEIYAWAIDFFGIQKGDLFKIIYDEKYVDSTSLNEFVIHAACFTHYNKDYWAFEFEQDSLRSFYDENGNSLRKAFLKAPLRFSRISSRFSNSRYHPVLKIRRPHHGVDYAAPTGTPVHSIGDGIVIKKGYQKRGGGRYVKVKHNSVYTTSYMHFSKFAKGIKVGTAVSQGQTIGYVGQSGLATGPHLDFRVYKNGTAIDPLKLESPPVEPVKQENKSRFEKDVEYWTNKFNDLKL